MSRPADAVRILEHARSRTPAPATRALLDIRRARASAVLQDHPAVERVPLTAEAELERARPDTTTRVMSWMSTADLNADAGRCWLDLGDSRRARSAITSGLDGLDPQRLRTRSGLLTYWPRPHSRVEMSQPQPPTPAPLSTRQHSPAPPDASTWHTPLSTEQPLDVLRK